MEKQKRRFGDRKDARRVRDLTGMAQINMDLKPNRSVSDVYINQKLDVTKLREYIEKKKNEGKKITYFHAFMTAIGKVYYNRPRLNYFVANRHLYEHNDVTISFVAKVTFDDKSEEMMVLIKIDPDDNIFSISKKIMNKVDEFRKNSNNVDKKGANNAIDILAKLPNIIRVPLIGILKWTDKVGILPSSLIEDNLYYSSLIVSNLGAIKCGAIHHNINDFGTASGLATMGEVKDEEVIDENGKKSIRKVCEWGINLDERIADGYYFAQAVNMLQYLFNNPELLEESASTKIEEIKIR